MVVRTGDKCTRETNGLCLQDETLEHDNKYYDVSETPVKDKSMLGTHCEELCENLDVYWMTQTCDAHTSSTGKCKYHHTKVQPYF